MLKFACLIIPLAALALGDVSSVVDEVLEETRSRLPDSIAYRPLHYVDRAWDSATGRYVKQADLRSHDGHLLLGRFRREGTPILYGDALMVERVLESRFVMDLQLQYENYTAVNFTSGANATGSMSVSYQVTEMFTWVKLSKQGASCKAEVSTFTPVSMSDPVAVLTPPSTLGQELFSEAKYTLNFYLNHTLVNVGLPIFADVVSKSTDLCSLMSK